MRKKYPKKFEQWYARSTVTDLHRFLHPWMDQKLKHKCYLAWKHGKALGRQIGFHEGVDTAIDDSMYMTRYE